MKARCPFCSKTIIVPSASEALVEENKKLLEEVERLRAELDGRTKEDVGPILDKIEKKKEMEKNILPTNFIKSVGDTKTQTKEQSTIENRKSDLFKIFNRTKTPIETPTEASKINAALKEEMNSIISKKTEAVSIDKAEEKLEEKSEEKLEKLVKDNKKDAYGINDVPVVI